MNIVLTGCSRGIGKALLKLLLREGHSVISISRQKTELTSLSNEEAKNWTEINADLMESAAHQLVHDELNKLDKLDGLINNAGYLVNKAFSELSYNDVRTSFDINVYAPIKMAQLCIPYIKDSANPFLINIGSVGGVQGSLKFPGLSVYSSSKGALSILTECLAEEYKETKIHFNCLALGAVQTEMLEQAFPGYIAPYTPEQMASFILSFIVHSSPMMNGKIISVSASNP